MDSPEKQHNMAVIVYVKLSPPHASSMVLSLKLPKSGVWAGLQLTKIGRSTSKKNSGSPL